MRKTGVLIALSLLAGISALAGSDPWEGKPYAQWTEQDVAVILQTSPWVKTVAATGAWRPSGTHAALPIGDPHVGTAQADNAIHPSGPKTYNILWGSARTVRAATQTVTGAVFYFSKKEAAISSEEKEIDFYLQIGETKLLTSFDLHKMVDSRGLDL